MKKYAIFFVITVAILTALAGCNNALSLPGTTGSGMGSIVFSFNTPMSRAIMPDTTLNSFNRFDLVFTAKTAGNADFSEVLTRFSGVVDVPSGTWDITITAFFPDGKAGARAELENIVIYEGETRSVPVRLAPMSTGTGTFSWEITAHDGVSAIRLEAHPLDANGEPVGAPITADTSGTNTMWVNNVWAGSLPLAAGEYQVLFTVESDRSRIRSEIERVLKSV